jgi:hypothetical protein
VKDRFRDFYKAMFSYQVAKENMSTIFTDYAWDMGWCDPCAADPLSSEKLRQLGVFWLAESFVPRRGGPGGLLRPSPVIWKASGAHQQGR